jgi:GrpB-like predicted nucleotidyltransferase (UPF0157 family)
MKKYKFVRFNKKYSKLFKKEKRKLLKFFPKAKIEHIGSTSIQGLGGKGIIDIMLAFPKSSWKKNFKKLIKLKYSKKETGGSNDRIFFEKSYGFVKKRKVHLHLTYINSKTYNDALKFRTILRKNKDLKDKYSKIKQKAVSLKKKGKDYQKHKNQFIKEILKG